MSGYTHTENRWYESAACNSTDPDAFFSDLLSIRAKAKEICSRCSVVEECLQDALDNKDHHGIRGGMSPQERRALARRLSRKRS